MEGLPGLLTQLLSSFLGQQAQKWVGLLLGVIAIGSAVAIGGTVVWFSSR